MRQRTGISTAAAELQLARRSWPRVSAALRRQRSHVRIVSGAPILSGTSAILTFSLARWCHRGVTSNFRPVSPALEAFSAPQLSRATPH
jgi:hypothetical protein